MLNRFHSQIDALSSENTLLLILAVALGLFTSLGVTLFRLAITFFEVTFRAGGIHLFGTPLAIIPLLGLAGLIVGGLIGRFIGEERHHGVAGIMEAAAYAGGRLRFRRMPLKVLLAAFSLGAGASAGPEDPSVQVGSNIGSALAQWLKFSDERGRLLVAAGAAGGIATAFHAPIAGVFFALEVILGDFSTGTFGVVVLTAVVSSATAQAIAVSGPELGTLTYSLSSPLGLPVYALLGLIAAPIAAGFIGLFYQQADFWHHLKLPRPIRTGLVGLLVGVIAYFLPQVMGSGTDLINTLVNASAIQTDVALLIALTLAKIVATTLILGGGFMGGMFAPALFVGATLGSAFGQVMTRVLPVSMLGDPAGYAIAGMAAMIAGVIRAPITAILLLFELTDDYRLILPLMLTTAVCLLVAERLAPDGIYQVGLARKGIRLSAGREVVLMDTVYVRDVMTAQMPLVLYTLPAAELEAQFARYNTRGLIVVDEKGCLMGIVTTQDLRAAIEAGPLSNKLTADICTREVITVTPDDTMAEALRRLGSRDLGRLPVIAVDDPCHILGLLRRRDVIAAYERALSRRQVERQKLRGLIEKG